MQELGLKRGSLFERSKKIGGLIVSDNDHINHEVANINDRFHVVAGIVCLTLAAASLIAVLVTWVAYVQEGRGWPNFGWWFVIAFALTLGCMILSVVRDKTGLLQEQERAIMKQESAADLKLNAARVIVKAVAVWEAVCRQYARVHGVVNGRLDAAGEEQAARCHAFLTEGYLWIERAIDYFDLKKEFAPLERRDQAPAGDPGYLAHADKLNKIIDQGMAADFGRHLVHAVASAPVMPAAAALMPA